MKALLPFDLVVFDLETNARDIPDVRITEIGAVRVSRDLKIQDSFSQLVNATADGIPLDPHSVSITGITEEMIRDAPVFSDAAAKFEEWCKKSDDYLLAAWGCYFDVSVLRYEYNRCHRRYDHHGQAFDLKTAAWYELWKQGTMIKKTGLGTMVEQFKVDFEGARHRGKDDALAEARIFIKAFEMQRK